MSGGGVGGHPLPQPGAGPPRRRRCRSRGAAPAAAWKVSRRFWGALPPHRRRRPPCARGRGEGAGGAGAPRNAAAGSPPPVPYPLFPPWVTPFGRAGGGWVRRTTFWEGVGGGFGGEGKPSECPPPPPKLPARGAPGRSPEHGTRGRGEGLPWLHLRSPAHAGAGGCLSPAGAGLGPSATPLSQDPLPGREPQPAGTSARGGTLGSPYPARAVSGPSHVPAGTEMSLWAGVPLGWGLCGVLLPPRTANERILSFREKNVW